MKKDKTIQDLLNDINNFLDTINDSINEIDGIVNDIDEKLEEYGDSIKDVNNFIFELKLNNLHSQELEKFIYEYLKYKNK